MNALPIIALVGIAILVTSTIGFGASLSSTPTFNLIGASDNNEVSTARGNITGLVWTEEVSDEGVIETDLITFGVGNEHTSSAINFEVCTVIERQDGTFNPTASSAPYCTFTGLIAAYGNETNSITLTTPMNVTDIVDISFSIQEMNLVAPP